LNRWQKGGFFEIPAAYQKMKHLLEVHSVKQEKLLTIVTSSFSKSLWHFSVQDKKIRKGTCKEVREGVSW
jgi:hypothetical protein